ncbi:hypothetical protein R1flu_001116 [Riccia fluitans]|uniref:Ubiquitin-like protease family profile domain-containing protein n=1 Tax=Riccia fluitans TaxID=41844 RepID=A0ABD1Y2Q4_9MARC
MAIAMEAVEEVTRAAIDPTVPDSQEATTGDISPAIDSTQPADNARGVGPNNIQQEDEDLQLIPPNGIPSSVALGINFNYDVFKHDFLMRDAAWMSEVRKAMLHYMGLEMHGVKVDWSIVDISIPLNTISREMRMSTRRKLYQMKVKMDGKLVEPFDPDELERPRKTVRSNPSKKSDVPLPPNARAEAPTPRKGKEKMVMQPKNAFEDEVRNELRELKEAITMSRQEAKAIARSQKETTTRLSQSSAGPSNHMEGIDVRRGQPAASLQTPLASMAEYRNTVARMLEECEWAVERNTSLEEELVIAERKIDELRQRRLVLTTVHKALSEWRVDNLLPSTSFIIGHRLLASDVDRAGVDTSNLLICHDFKLVAASHRSPQLFYEHLKSIYDSYVNLDNNPDVQPLVKGVDAEYFDVDAFLGTDMGGSEENITDSTVVPTVGCSIDLTADEAVDEPCSPPDRQIISVVPSQRVHLTVVVSPEANKCITTEWPRLSDLTKEDRKSTYARKYLRGDVINAYIFEKFLQRSREELFNMFYCNIFWFAKASQQVDAYDMTSHSESASIGIKRMRNTIYPQLRDGDFKVPHQLDQYSCGIHIIQMLAGAGMKGLGLDQCWRVEKLAWIATIDQVTTMGIMLSSWLNGKFNHVP